MKLLTNINPKKIFQTKKSRSVSRSNPSSFSSSDSSSDVSDLSKPKSNGLATPTSVLPAQPDLLWSQIAEGVNMELIQAFKIIDGDGDGKITKSELTTLLSRVGAEPISEEEVDLMLSEVDRENDGSISLEKLGSIGSAFEPAPCQAELLETFNFFDTDHDGKITAEELLNVFSSIGDGRCTLEDCRRMISGVDKNGDGFVCFEDFARMMEPHLYT